MAKILVTGGAGYIGSHTAHLLLQHGHDVVVVDNLSRGHKHNVPPERLRVLSLQQTSALTELLKAEVIEAVIHFAAYIAVGESTQVPELYFSNNTCGSVSLLSAMAEAGVKRLVFSSTAAVYGRPSSIPITEDQPTRPINPYGETKLAIEKMLASYAYAYGLRFAALRYFNAAGAAADTTLVERHDPETHLIPIVLDAAAGRRPDVTIYGQDYPTPDGTCVRDYIHVVDLADAHLAALAYLERGGESGAFNLGTGEGHSVAEVVRTCRAVTRREITVAYGERREGDPPVLVASPSLAEERFGWRARRSSLETIVEDAWRARQREHGAPDDPTNTTPPRRRNQEQPNAR
jgi:UDP-glucose 4-epimerase